MQKRSFPSLWNENNWSVSEDESDTANAYGKPRKAELQYHHNLICTSGMIVLWPDAKPSDQPCWLPGMNDLFFLEQNHSALPHLNSKAKPT